MKLLSWNVRGFGRSRTVRRLRLLLRDINPSVVFLIETKLPGSNMAAVRRKCGLVNGIDVDSDGRSGGLSLGWRSELNVTLRSYLRRHIVVLIVGDSDGHSWRCTGFYRAPKEARREESGRLLCTLNDCLSVPWLVIGDFNEITYASEKRGGLPRREIQMRRFRNALSDCSLSNLGYKGHWFTWEHGCTNENNIRERLDRGVANKAWGELFPTYFLRHLPHGFSDHCPILLSTNLGYSSLRSHPFRFEAAWLLEDSCESRVESLWRDAAGNIPKRLWAVGNGLSSWFGELQKERRFTKRELKSRLLQLSEQFPLDEVLGEILETKLFLNIKVDHEELY